VSEWGAGIPVRGRGRANNDEWKGATGRDPSSTPWAISAHQPRKRKSATQTFEPDYKGPMGYARPADPSHFGGPRFSSKKVGGKSVWSLNQWSPGPGEKKVLATHKEINNTRRKECERCKGEKLPRVQPVNWWVVHYYFRKRSPVRGPERDENRDQAAGVISRKDDRSGPWRERPDQGGSMWRAREFDSSSYIAGGGKTTGKSRTVLIYARGDPRLERG